MLSKRLLLLVVLACALGLPSAAGADVGTPIPGQYIVLLKGGAKGREVAAEHARSAHVQILHTYDAALHGYAARIAAGDLAKVKADPRVKAVVPDEQGYPAFGASTKPPPPPPPGQTLPTEVNRVDADLSPTAQLAGDGSGDVNGAVAIYDSGIDTKHPDLNVAGGIDCLDKNSYNDGTYSDAFGHGTHVAGIVGAKDNGIGVVGVAPGVRLYSVRVLNSSGGGSTSGMLCGINWITANGPALGIKVVNASLQLFGRTDDGNCGYTVGDVLHQALCGSLNAGITWVFAAGNSSADYSPIAGAGYRETLAVTASADSNGLPNVGSTAGFSCTDAMFKSRTSEIDDTTASFSNYAGTAAEQARTVAAPGACINSTLKGQTYGLESGTSMSAPVVTGTVELCILSGQCTGTPADVINKIVADAASYNTATPGYGFKGDPQHSPVAGHYIGYQVSAAGY